MPRNTDESVSIRVAQHPPDPRAISLDKIALVVKKTYFCADFDRVS